MRRSTTLALALLALPTVSAHAGSFFSEDSSVIGSGRAFAGQSARADDAGAVFYNPANVVGTQPIQTTLSSTLAFAHVDLDDTGSDISTPGTASGPARVAGGDGGNPLGATPLASLSIAFELPDERTWVGLSVNAPFGVDIDYGNQWFGRYAATKTQLAVIDVSPTLGFALTEQLTLGASVFFRYTEADFQSALPDPLALAGPTPETDGDISIDGDDWDLGYALGLRYRPLATTTIGIAYRSGTGAELDGRARIRGLSGALSSRNGSMNASTQLGLPDMILIGVAHDVTPRLTLLAQANWFDWSDFDTVKIGLEDGTRILDPQGYHDSWSGSLGVEYRMTGALTLRTGAQVDKTPVDDSLRNVRTPDEDRVRLSLGLTYALRENLRLDFAYSHIFLDDTEIDRTDVLFDGTPAASTARTRARSKAGGDVIGVALRYEF